MYQMDSLEFLSPALNTLATCPACPKVLFLCYNSYMYMHIILQERGLQIVSLDALFGLCRKKSSGTSHRPPLFSSIFFEDQDSVDAHVTSYSISDTVNCGESMHNMYVHRKYVT